MLVLHYIRILIPRKKKCSEAVGRHLINSTMLKTLTTRQLLTERLLSGGEQNDKTHFHLHEFQLLQTKSSLSQKQRRNQTPKTKELKIKKLLNVSCGVSVLSTKAHILFYPSIIVPIIYSMLCQEQTYSAVQDRTT